MERSRDFDVEHVLGEVPWLRRLAARLVADPAGAEDVAQETLLAAVERRPATGKGLQPWLTTVARRVAGKRRRSAARVERRERDAARPEAVRSAADEAAERELREILAAALSELDEPYRRTVLLRTVGGLEPAEIARREGVPAATVRSRLARGLEQLRGVLDRRLHGRGGRAAWVALVLRVAPEAKASTAAAAAAGGAIAMASWTKWAAAAAVVAAGIAAWRVAAPSEPSEGRDADVGRAMGPPAPVAAGGEAGRAEGPSAAEDGAASGRVLAGAAAPATRALQVLSDEGAALPGARLVVFRGGEVLWSGDADEGGAAEVPAGEGLALFVVADGRAPWSAELPARGRAVVQLPRGEVLSGWIRVDGAPPGEPLPLSLASARDWQGLDEVPPAALDAAYGSSGARSPSSQLMGRTEPDGAFSFAGLSPKWRGTLYLPRTHAWLDPWVPRQDSGVLLESSFEGRVLEATLLPLVRGRIVGGDGAPLHRVRGDVAFESERTTSRVVPSFRTDEEGRFRVPLRTSAFQLPAGTDAGRVSATVSARAEGRRDLEVRFGPEPVASERDLGTLRMEWADPPRSLALSVRDPGGEPIEGALAMLAGAHRPLEGRSGADGRLEIEVPAGAREIGLVAAARVPALLRVPAESGGDVTVVLEPTNELVLRVTGPDGRGVEGGEVVLDAGTPLFPRGGPPWVDRMASFAGATAGRARPGTTEVLLRSGGARLYGVVAGVPLRLQVLDALGQVVHAEELPPLPQVGRIEHQVRLPAPLDAIEGRVLDADGEPVLGDFSVVVGNGSEPTRGGFTIMNGDGTFRFGGLAPGTYLLVVFSPGFAPAVVEGVAAALSPTPVDVRLRPAAEVRVRVRDTAGRPVAARVRTGTPETNEVEAVEVEPGLYLLGSLPPEVVRIEAEIGGKEYSLDHDARIPEALLEVPPHGAVEVRFDAAAELEDGTYYFLDLEPLEPDLPRPGKGQFGRELARFGARFPAVLPGRYRLRVQRQHETEVRADGVDAVAPVELRVRAGETAEVVAGG